ncbi:MAG: hypothetical protein ACSLE2_12845 [Lysobacterales bacterium]
MRPGRKKNGGRFAMLPLALLQHVCVRTLTHAAFRLLVLLAGEYNGRNNGALGITAGQAEKAGFSNQRTLYRSFRELEQRGLIVRTYPASRVPPRPTMWSITWQSVDDTDYSTATHLPSHRYRSWSPTTCAA